MKKLLAILTVFLIVIIAVCAFAEPIFAFEYLSYEVGVKKTMDLKPILQGAELTGKVTYTWESDNPEIATVNNKGRVTGVGPGTTTIRVSVEDGAGASYSTSCEIHVLQMVEKITFDAKEVKVAVFHTLQLTPKVYPENASNPELVFSTSDKNSCWVNPKTGKISGVTGNTTCYVTAEATDGSGVKQKIKVNVQTFVIPEEYKQIEITERKTYYLYFDGLTDGHTFLADNYYFKYPKNQDVAYLGNHTGGDDNGWFGIAEKSVTNPDTNKKETKHMLRVEPYKKAGKISVTFYDSDTTWGRGFTKETIDIIVKPSAVYGKEAFPPMKYEEVLANPGEYTGKDTQLSGIVTSVDFREAGSNSTLQLVVATKGKDSNLVACVVKGRYAKVLKTDYQVGDKVTVYGAWDEPREIKTETGLSVTNLLLNIERINDDILNEDMVMQKRK